MDDGTVTRIDQTAESSAGDIQVVARSAQILRCYSYDNRSLKVLDVAAELGVGRTTAHRYLASLANAGLLHRDSEGGYRLGPLLVHVGALALNGLGVVEVAEPYLRELADTASETSVLSVWGGRSPIVVRSREPQDRLLNISIRVGRTLNLDTAQSAVFLAHRAEDETTDQLLAQLDRPHQERIRARIADARELGIAVSDTVNQGVRAIATAVFDANDAVVATMAIIGTVHTLPADPESGQVLALRDTAGRLSLALGHRRGTSSTTAVPGV